MQQDADSRRRKLPAASRNPQQIANEQLTRNDILCSSDAASRPSGTPHDGISIERQTEGNVDGCVY